MKSCMSLKHQRVNRTYAKPTWPRVCSLGHHGGEANEEFIGDTSVSGNYTPVFRNYEIKSAP